MECELVFHAIWAAIYMTQIIKAMSSIIETLQKYFCDRGKANQSLLAANNKNNDGASVE
jgi:hypothetical protein